MNKKVVLFILIGFVVPIAQAGTIKLINDSDRPVFVTAQKMGCFGICSTDHPGFSGTTTTRCCLTKLQGVSTGGGAASSIGSAAVTAATGVMTSDTPAGSNPGWYIQPGGSEQEDFSRSDYTFYVYQQGLPTEWVNWHVNQGAVLHFPNDFSPNK